MTQAVPANLSFGAAPRTRRHRTVLGAALCALWMVTGAYGLASGPTDGAPTVIRDIVYYEGPDFHPQRHILDLYLPVEGADLPVLIFIHGGGWRSGNKSIYGYLGNTFARQGYAVVIANYRLTDGTPQQVMHPGHIEDVARSFAWVSANIGDYGGDRGRIFISGHSAGGHLVTLLAMDAGYLAAHDLTLDAIRGVMSLSGVYDVRNASFAAIFGDPEQRAQASPITHVGESPTPPFQVLYGDNNLPGLGPQAVEFYNALADVPSDAELIEFPGRTHTTMISRIANPGDEVAEAMLRFMSKH